MASSAMRGVTTRSGQPRLLSLDVFRGLTIIGMLLVNDPGDASATYTQLKHAAWSGWTIADLVFPFFLFVVGITTHLSLSARAGRGDDNGTIRRRIVRRGAIILLIGFLLNWFPFYQFGAIAGHPSPTFLDRVIARLHEVRFLGVLQRIGIAYVAAALVTWRTPTKRVVAITVVLLVGYWLAMTLLPVPGEGAIGAQLLNDKGRTLAAWVDRITLDWSRWQWGNHIWNGSRVFDPEGLLSTIPAVGTVMIGVLVGRWLLVERGLGDRLRGLLFAGVPLIVGGLVWGLVFPINKNLWSSSYVLFTAGVACCVLAMIAWLVDVRQCTTWTKPFVVFGVNPITAYVGAELTAVLLDSTLKVRSGGRLVSVHALFHERALATWLAPGAASLAYALCIVAVWYGILAILYRKGVIIRI